MDKISKYLAVGALIGMNASAAPKQKELEEQLRAVPVPELPARAVALIKAAEPTERGEVASTVVRTIVARHPAAAPTIVSTIQRETPEVSKVAAQAAAAASGASQAPAPFVAPKPVAERPLGVTGTPAVEEGRRSAEASAVGQRNSADHAPSQGVVVVRPGPVKYHKPLPNPPRRPVNPPVRKGLNDPRRQ